jgi:hypothetical protein
VDPTLFAFALGMGSAITLAGANTFVKAARDILGARTVMTATGSVLVLPFLFLVPLPSPATWGFLALGAEFIPQLDEGAVALQMIRGNSGQGETFAGCRITKLTLKISASGYMTAVLDIIGMSYAARTTASSPSVTTNETRIGANEGSTIAWNSGTYTPKDTEWVLDNKLGRRQLIGSLYTADPSPSDYQEISAQVGLEHTGDALYTAYLADTSSDLVQTFTSGSRTFKVEVHNGYIPDNSAPMNGAGTVSESVTFMGESDGTDLGMEIVIVNTQATGIAA